ncbi:MAG: SEC-C domain-containing protein [Desulfuromonadales bacterium]|nr:SEC-C domain-containing protein [Desulfuromonadales bacterium]
MKRSVKIGVNDMCPCGSGRKYKKCHKLKPDEPVPMNMPMEVIKEFRRKGRTQRLQDKEFQRKFGKVRQPVSCEGWGKRIVAVGSKLVTTSKDASFHGFLVDYLCDLLDEDWLKEIPADGAKEHPIKKYYRDTIVEETSYKISNNPSYVPFITLAYDLFILNSEMILEKKLLERLKHGDQYPGARYELLLATTFLRAGFGLEFEDESDGSQTHVEFTATHKEKKISFHVEGKRSESEKHNYGNLVNDALRKKKNLPLIVFVDMNKPEKSARDYLMNNKKVRDLINKKITKDESGVDLYDLLVVTNHPWEYFEIENGRIEILRRVLKGRKQIDEETKKLVETLKASFSQYANVPANFPANF